jgi:hypothetical protein
MGEAQAEAKDRADVEADQVHAVQVERIKERDGVCDELLLGVAVGRRVGPAGSTQVWSDDSVMLR